MTHRKWDLNNIGASIDRASEHNALFEAWIRSEMQATIMGRKNDEMCDRIAELQERVRELEQPVRVPFTDVQIEKMARAAFVARYGISDNWELQSAAPTTKAMWCGMIRAALAAGGIEPCAPPEYSPDDVALHATAKTDEELAKLAYESHYEYKDVSWQKMGERLQAYWYRTAGTVRAAVEAPLLAEIERLRTGWCGAEEKLFSANAERDLAQQERDAALAELAAVKAERDNLASLLDASQRLLSEPLKAVERAEKAESKLAALHPGETVEHVMMERDSYRIRLDHAEQDLAALRQPGAHGRVRWDVTPDEACEAVEETVDRMADDDEVYMRNTMHYLAAHAVIDVPPGVPSVEELHKIGARTWHKGNGSEWNEIPLSDADRAAATAIRDRVIAGMAAERAVPSAPTPEQVEALARVLHSAQNEERFYPAPKWTTLHEDTKNMLRRGARAAFAHIGADVRTPLALIGVDPAKPGGDATVVTHFSPCPTRAEAVPGVDPDAWKTPLELRCKINNEDICRFSAARDSVVMEMMEDGKPSMCDYWVPTDAARLALWAASYAAAHGCPVDVRTKGTWSDEPLPGSDEDRTIYPYPEPACPCPTRAEAEADWAASGKHPADWIYENLLPLLPESRTPEPETPKGLPTPEEIVYLPNKSQVFNNELIIAAYKALHTRHMLEWDQEKNKDGWRRVVDVIRNATYETLRPWLKTPVGWTLDVTAKEAYRAWGEAPGDNIDAFKAVLDLCRSRITPVYDCPECARNYEHFRWLWRQSNITDDYLKGIVLSERAKAYPSARAALEGE